MSALTATTWFGLLLTLGAWELATRLARRWRAPLLNPVLLCVAGIIGILAACRIPYAAYNEGGRWLSFLLGPSVVALAVPLIRQFDRVRANLLPIAGAMAVSATVGIASAIGLVALFGGSLELAVSMAPKSITTPIAMGVSQQAGGVPELTVALVILTGILGAATGPEFLRRLRLGDAAAMGLGIGASAHGIGTARALEVDPLAGAMSGIALTINGALTALVMPYLLPPLILFFRHRFGA